MQSRTPARKASHRVYPARAVTIYSSDPAGVTRALSGVSVALAPDQVTEVNALQLRGAIDYVYLRPGSPLMDTVRSFADLRKKNSGTAAA